MVNLTPPIDLKAVRGSLGWSQLQMAGYLGCDRSTVSRIEKSGQASGPIRKHLDRLAAEKGVPTTIYSPARA